MTLTGPGKKYILYSSKALVEVAGDTPMDISFPVIPPTLIDCYLNLLDVRKRKPNIEALSELVEAHLVRVPFENISKLYYKKRFGLQGIPNLELFLDGISRFHFGGTCYSNNYYLYQLLANLGYQIRLCGADMSKPDVHMASMVTVEGREYLVDAGYAAPFLAPIPRDLATDYTIALGRERYVLKPQDAKGCSRMELYRDGILKHGYSIKPRPRQFHEFQQTIADSYRQEATFMNSLLLVRFFPSRSLVIHNLTLIESEGTTTRIQALTSRDELSQIIAECFGIHREITIEAMSGLGKLESAWN
jgi:N-hydroxyarylamine O-acetyltransferase